MIYIQLIILLLIMIAAYYLNHHDYMAPGFIFATSFAFSTFWACMYAKEWGLGLHDNTFLVIISGVIVFVIVSGMVHMRYNKRRKHFINSNHNVDIQAIKIKSWKLNTIIILD